MPASPRDKYNKLANKRVLLIGGSSGIGFAVAELCLSASCTIVIASSSADKIARKLSELRTSFPSIPQDAIQGEVCDLGSFDTLEANIVKTLEAATASGTRKIDHVVFTAGDSHKPPALADLTLPHVFGCGRVRFFAPMMLAKHLPKYLTHPPSDKAEGRECSITLTNGYSVDRPVKGWTAENCYAGAIQQLTRGLSMDMAPVRVNCVSVGFVRTEIFDRGFRGKGEDAKDAVFAKLGANTLTGHVGDPEDIAEIYIALMKDRQATGTMPISDGGLRFGKDPWEGGQSGRPLDQQR